MPRRRFVFTRSLVSLALTLVAGSRLEAAEGLQPFVNRLMAGKQGAVIVAGPRNGRILAVWQQQAVFHEDSARDRALAALGVQGVTVPPAQLLMAYSAVATGGEVFGLIAPAERRGDQWAFFGHGLGHGVGLCQAGADQMGSRGLPAERILLTYFPGTEVATLPAGDTDPVASSEHFELAYPSSQEVWVTPALRTLERWRRELGAHAGVLPLRVRVQTWATTEEFIRATGEPGWMAAASDGESIALQPLSLLARKRILDRTLRHELTHLVVHKLGAKGVPRWFEEGFVLYLTGERITASAASRPVGRPLDAAITKPRSEVEMKAAYARALRRVQRLAQSHGDAALWQALEHPTAEARGWFRGKD